jgi:hypothetical protein
VPVDHDFEPNTIVFPDHHTSIIPANPAAPAPLRWDDYVNSLPSWETTLLATVTFVDKTLLLRALRTDPHLFLASDGGAADKKGSFGALLANSDTVILECAEGYVLLTILRLVFHDRYFYITRNHPLRFTLFCENKSLLDRLTASRAFPRRYLYSEADVEMQILSALSSLGNVTLKHVKGHQDENDDGEPLSWEAQLNQRYDELARTHLDSARDTPPLVPFLPDSKGGLVVNETSITHHYSSQLRTLAGLPAYKAYLRDHHVWAPTVFKLVDWPAFHSCTLMLKYNTLPL